MKLSVALFFAGIFGALATVFILLSFGTDYWLLASETCQTDSPGALERGDVLVNQAAHVNNTSTFHHEGFFWRCSFGGQTDQDNMMTFWFSKAKFYGSIYTHLHKSTANQPYSKVCVHAYLSPFPVSQQTHNTTTLDSAIIYRGFWSVFMLLGVAAVVVGGFVIICAAPFTSHCLYKAGGAFFLIAGFFLLVATAMYVIWLEAMDVLEIYVGYQRDHICPSYQFKIQYGLSFMFAPVGVFFSLLSGLLFFLIGRSVQIRCH